DGRPSLPPRIRSSTIAEIPITPTNNDTTFNPTPNGPDNPFKRKPAPTVQPLPRYSMVVGPSSQQPPATMGHIPFYNSVEETGEELQSMNGLDSELPEYEAMPESATRTAIPRKPVPKSLSKGEV
ncbi:MAG: hypothetical protein Q9180_007828, partial [Flavoplaca navasiana]